MYNSDTELLFPIRVLPALRSLRGEAWQKLVDRVHAADCEELDRLAFVLMMVRMSGCTTCNADSYKALRGCTACSKQTIQRQRANDQELLEQFAKAREFVKQYYVS